MRSAAADVPAGKPAAAARQPAAITRRFVNVAGRRVHCRIVGSGPPALFVHSSPANSAFVVNDMLAIADDYTCYAFDTPGFGFSDALPGDRLTASALADALADTLAAIAMPPCPVFGTHTGATIALELAARHPARVTGVVLDGLACFSQPEIDALLLNYFQKIPIDALGGQYSATWTRIRDQSTWFPWFARAPAALNESDLTSPAATDRWVTMYFDAADSYIPAYLAAITYTAGPERVNQLTMPAVFTAVASDMLYPHLARLNLTRPDHRIEPIGNSLPARYDVMRAAFGRFGSAGPAPILDPALTSSDTVCRQFVAAGGQQLMLRWAGERANPPLVILHDVPGAGGATEARMLALADRFFTVSIDLPGCGESDALAGAAIADIAALVWQACASAGITETALLGIGFGSAVAAEMAALDPGRVTRLALEGVLLADAAERADLRASYAPPVTIAPDGSHWFRTWQMIRDAEIWWPWDTPVRAALRRVEGDFGATSLHRRTQETLRQPGGYAALVSAALDHDTAASVRRAGVPTTMIAGSLGPLAGAYDARARAVLPDLAWATLAELDPA